MRNTQYFDPRTNRWLDENDLPGGVIPDGGRMRVALSMMDSGAAVQDARDAAYDAMCARLDPTTPCKSDHFSNTPQQPTSDELRDAADAAYESYCRALSDGAYHKEMTQ